MQDEFTLADKSYAWARMRQKRECPTLSRLRLGGEAVKRHLKNCARCKDRYEDMHNSSNYENVFSKVSNSAFMEPKSGQIRKIREEAGRYPQANWEDNLYSPPLVVVLTEPDSTLGSVRVAQIHDEPALAGPGDVPIDIPAGIRFAEAWNTYPVQPDLLGPVLYTAPIETVREILSESHKPLPSVIEDEHLEAFRELEVETGYHFNQLSIAQGLEKLDNQQGRMINKPSTKIIPFSLAQKSASDKKTPLLKSYWKPLASAACMALVIGAIFLNNFGSPDKDSKSAIKSIPASPSISSRAMRPSSKSSNAGALSAQSSLISALQLYLASNGDTTRGEEEKQTFDWEKDDYRKDIPPEWQAYAAGQWAARAALNQSESPFPKKWLPAQGDISFWQNNSYYALGFTAYAADLACQNGRNPSVALADALEESGIELEKRLDNNNLEAVQFSKALQNKPLTCDKILEKLDALDAISPLY